MFTPGANSESGGPVQPPQIPEPELKTPRGLVPSSFGSRLHLLVLTILVILGLHAYGIQLGARDFLGDEYITMSVIQLPLAEYMDSHHYNGTITSTFWICNRLSGGELWAYRLPSLVCGSLTLVLMAFICFRYFQQSVALAIPCLALASFSLQNLFFFRFGMPTYALYTFLSVVLLWAALRFGESHKPVVSVVVATAIGVVAPLIYLVLLIPFSATAVLIAYHAFVQRRGSRPLLRLRYSLLCAGPLVLGFVSFAVRWLTVRNDVWQLVTKRSEVIHLYFNHSPFPQSLRGMIEYVWRSTLTILRELGTQATGLPTWDYHAGQWLFPLVAMGAVIGLITLFRTRARPTPLNTIVLFTVLTLLAPAALGLLGLFPFGRARYTMFLMFPAFLLAGLPLHVAAGWSGRLLERLQARPGVARVGRALRLPGATMGVTALLAFSLLVIGELDDHRMRERMAYDRIISIVKTSRADLALVDRTNAFWMEILAPNKLKAAVAMRPRGGGPEIVPSADADAALARRLAESRRVVTVTRNVPWSDAQKAYPHYWSKVSELGFQVVESVCAGEDCASVLERK